MLLGAVTAMRLLHSQPHVPAVRNNKKLMIMWRAPAALLCEHLGPSREEQGWSSSVLLAQVQVVVQLLFGGVSVFLSGKISGREGLYMCVGPSCLGEYHLVHFLRRGMQE